MWQDPVVKETRELRDQYAKRLKYDLNAIFEDAQQHQAKKGAELVSFPPRKPTIKPSAA
ncbi:MAG: hypothetical protein O2971_06565 [Proteobacteria bacterium]|nr:hypothetical protein [Pseudomonadota bacterium]